MSWLSEQNSVLLVAATLVSVAMLVLTSMMLLILRNRTSRYEIKAHRAVLSAMRESYESQIAHLSREMTATADRWRDANHLLLSAQRSPQQSEPKEVQPATGFLKGLKLEPSDYIVDPKLILVLTPFSEDERRTFQIIQRICTQAGFRCVRGDEDYTPSDILSHVVKLIVKARIIIGNISGRNPNVFYELGIAHALGKQTLLISQALDDVPFDVAGLRILLWRSRQDLEQSLSQALLRIMADDPQPVGWVERRDWARICFGPDYIA
jgi:hypothetical protein